MIHTAASHGGWRLFQRLQASSANGCSGVSFTPRNPAFAVARAHGLLTGYVRAVLFGN